LANLQDGAGFCPIFGERRRLKIQMQAYNVFNTAEFSGVGAGLQWDAKGALINQPSVGVFNATLPSRILAIGARLEF
jgi:hypothetical protein